MISTSKMKAVFILLFLFFLLFIRPVKGEVGRIRVDRKTYDLYPQVSVEPPGIPSPFTTDDGLEVVTGITKKNEYVLVPVTVGDGERYVYGRSGKGKQLEVDGKDFPTLARTGLHSEFELDQAKTITGLSIAEITYKGRPDRFSGAGFMAEDEDIISVLKGDNRLVKQLGLTHPRVAKPMFHIWNSILEQFEAYFKKVRPYGEVKTILYNGKKVSLNFGTTKGWQTSIFNDEIYGGCHIYIQRELDKEEKGFLEKAYPHLNREQMDDLIETLSHIHTGEMEPYYIMRYGFYEGHTRYRTDPIAIAWIFGLKTIEEIEAAFKGQLYRTLTGPTTWAGNKGRRQTHHVGRRIK